MSTPPNLNNMPSISAKVMQILSVAGRSYKPQVVTLANNDYEQFEHLYNTVVEMKEANVPQTLREAVVVDMINR